MNLSDFGMQAVLPGLCDLNRAFTGAIARVPSNKRPEPPIERTSTNFFDTRFRREIKLEAREKDKRKRNIDGR
jgi:hypothetical protein